METTIKAQAKPLSSKPGSFWPAVLFASLFGFGKKQGKTSYSIGPFRSGRSDKIRGAKNKPGRGRGCFGKPDWTHSQTLQMNLLTRKVRERRAKRLLAAVAAAEHRLIYAKQTFPGPIRLKHDVWQLGRTDGTETERA